MSGVILYEGPSMLDGKPIIVIATGLDQSKASRNGKTGAMIQTFIMRSDIAPHKAVKTGDDITIPANGIMANIGRRLSDGNAITPCIYAGILKPND